MVLYIMDRWILHSGSKAQDKGESRMVPRIPICMWPFGPPVYVDTEATSLLVKVPLSNKPLEPREREPKLGAFGPC